RFELFPLFYPFFEIRLSDSCVILTLFILPCAHSQDEKVALGIENYGNSQYKEALVIFNSVLTNLESLSKENLPKAFYYRAKTQMGIYHMAGDQDNKGSSIFFQAYDDYKKAQETDNGIWGLKVQADLQILYSSALQGAQSAINSSYNSSSQKQSLAIESEKFANVAIGINDSDYIAHDFLGQALLEQGKVLEAIKAFANAQKNYDLSGKIDFLMGYTYYRSALGYKDYLKDLESALQDIQRGKKKLNEDYQRFSSSNQTDPQLISQYDQALRDLKNFELDIYMNLPHKTAEAISVFEEHLKSDPNNYNKVVAYASLLEKTDTKKAEEIYKRAILIDSNGEVAYFNLGALYNNYASQISKKSVDETDSIKAIELQGQALEYLNTALPYFEKAFDVNASLHTAQALIQICSSLKMDDKHTYYKEKELTLSNN
ncbi:MAG: hypothetical protein O2951_09695, partial [Bacteroidetes bacterium]|nr:hypothetical protein [Bacteroidota bacterium]